MQEPNDTKEGAQLPHGFTVVLLLALFFGTVQSVMIIFDELSNV